MAALTRAPIRVGFDLKGRKLGLHRARARASRGSGRAGRSLCARGFAGSGAGDRDRTPRTEAHVSGGCGTRGERMDAWMRAHGLGSRALVACLPRGPGRRRPGSRNGSPRDGSMHGLRGRGLALGFPARSRSLRACQSRMSEPIDPSHPRPPGGACGPARAVVASGQQRFRVAQASRHSRLDPDGDHLGPTNPGACSLPRARMPRSRRPGASVPPLQMRPDARSGDRYLKCMRDVTVDQVVTAVRRAWRRGPGAPA